MSLLSELNLALPLKRKYGLTEFVETGCENLVGTKYAISIGFKNIYTCDIDESKVAGAFALINRMGMAYLGNSEDFLEYLMPSIDGKRCLFWLDAHFPSEFGMPGTAPEWPLPRELEILAKKKGIENDVIICDDIHCIRSGDNPTYNPGVLEERQQEGTIAELTAKLPLASRLLGLGNGILVFEPK